MTNLKLLNKGNGQRKKASFIYLTKDEVQAIKEIAKRFNARSLSDFMRIIISLEENKKLVRGLIGAVKK